MLLFLIVAQYSAISVTEYGALFQHYKNTPAALFCLVVRMAHQVAIGVFIGAMASRADPDDKENRRRQTVGLVVSSVLYLLYIVGVRPYHVLLANVFEAVAVLAQIVVLSRNFWFLDADSEVGGVVIEDSAEVAMSIYYVMLISIVCMLLRVIAVMTPTWCRLPTLAKLVLHHIPKLEHRRRVRGRKHLQELEAAVVKLSSRRSMKGAVLGDRSLSSRSLRSLGVPRTSSTRSLPRVPGPRMSPALTGRAKLSRAVRKIRAAKSGRSKLRAAAGKINAAAAMLLLPIGMDYDNTGDLEEGKRKLKRTVASLKETARILGVSRNTLRRRLRDERITSP